MSSKETVNGEDTILGKNYMSWYRVLTRRNNIKCQKLKQKCKSDGDYQKRYSVPIWI